MKIPLLFALLVSALLSTTNAASLSAQSIFGVRFDAGRSHPYDVLHTAIDVRFDEPRRMVIGSVTHRLRSIVEELAAIRLDADSAMRIVRVLVNGRVATYRLGIGDLEIVLPQAAHYGDTIVVAIDYRVVPSKGLYILAPDSSNPTRRSQIWTQGEAEDHHYWVPLYDYPNDRATTEMTITVRTGWSALSNGDLVARRDNADGTTTWHYRMDRPHASYLMMLAAGDYLVTRDTVDGIPLSYWSYPEMPERVAPTFSSTPDVMRYLVERIGVAYPWKSYAQVVVDEFMYGGMENTTASTLNDYVLVDARGRVDYDAASIIAHEAAHQWFGDLVTARDWGELWLQESYVTFLASKYLGHRYGEHAFLNDIYEGSLSALRLDSQSGRDPIAGGKGRTINLYQRGAAVLHMLERLVGEEPFWRATRLYLERHALGNVETADLKNAFEDATGVELDWFFDQWVHGAGAPDLAVSHEHVGDSLRVIVRQAQTRDSLTGLFRLQLPVAVVVDGATVRDTMWLDQEADTLTMAVATAPRMVIVDEGQTTLKRMRHERSRAELTAQLGAERMLDRWEAVRAITLVDSTLGGERWRVDALANAFRREPTMEVRDAIVQGAAKLTAEGVDDIVALGIADSSVDVRRGAVDVAYRIADTQRRAALLRERLADSSVRVIASAIGMLATTDTAGLYQTLMAWRGVEGRRGSMAQAWVGAVASARIESLVDDVAAYTQARYARTTRWQAYIALSALETTTPPVREAILRGLTDRASSIREAAIEAAHAHLDTELRTSLTALSGRLAGEDRGRIEAILNAN